MKLPLSFVVFLIHDSFLLVILGVEKTIPRDTWVSLIVGFGGVVCCLRGQSSLAQLVNNNRRAKRGKESGLTEIQMVMEEVNKGQELTVSSCSKARFRTNKCSYFLSS